MYYVLGGWNSFHSVVQRYTFFCADADPDLRFCDPGQIYRIIPYSVLTVHIFRAYLSLAFFCFVWQKGPRLSKRKVFHFYSFPARKFLFFFFAVLSSRFGLNQNDIHSLAHILSKNENRRGLSSTLDPLLRPILSTFERWLWRCLWNQIEVCRPFETLPNIVDVNLEQPLGSAMRGIPWCN